MKQRTFLVALTLILASSCLSISTGVYAHDVFAPDWRGDPGSTFQHWAFSTPDNPALPEFIDNTYGGAIGIITPGQFAMQPPWVDVEESAFGSQQGLWDLGQEGNIVLDIANRPYIGGYKDIWIQVTYFEGLWQEPHVEVPGAVAINGIETQLIENVGTGIWCTQVTKWRIFPNPLEEQIIIIGDQMGSLIDQIVVDTICVPEPSSIGLLTLVGVALLKQGRRGRS